MGGGQGLKKTKQTSQTIAPFFGSFANPAVRLYGESDPFATINRLDEFLHELHPLKTIESLGLGRVLLDSPGFKTLILGTQAKV